MVINSLETRCLETLEEIRSQGLYRQLRRVEAVDGVRIQVDGRWLTNFASNDYLGLAGHPLVRERALRALREYGGGAGASRLISGSLGVQHELEEAIANWKGVEAVTVFGSGYAAATGTLTALLNKNDVVIVDKLSHACLVEGAKASGATLRVFRHNDMSNLEEILRWSQEKLAAQPASGMALVVTESVFSMDGDTAPLARLVALKDQYAAALMVDEAHATGLYGIRGSGLIEHQGFTKAVDVQMGTLGKALGASGGYIAGSQRLRDLLINRAKSMIFSTAPVPAAAGAALGALDVIAAEGVHLRAQLMTHVTSWMRHMGIPLQSGDGVFSAIQPVMVGGEALAMKIAQGLIKAGYFVPAIRYPTVARGGARLRVTFSARHSGSDVEQLAQALRTATSSSED
jgi:7-keto-8-aminopelargonate synthetase-like enzyme